MALLTTFRRPSLRLPGAIAPGDSVHLTLAIAIPVRGTKDQKFYQGMSKDSDVGMDSERDDIILIVGLTGVGKSTFINAAAGHAAVSVGHDLQSCTTSIKPVAVSRRSRRIVFVDTPGFDDTWVGDKQILGRIVDWLASSCRGMKLAGIIYLHDISQARIEPAKENLKAFNMLCQPPAYINIVFATSKWSDVPADVGIRREQQLQSEHWTGSNVARFENTYESAWAIVDLIFEKNPVDANLFHKELVDVQSCLSPKAQAKITGGFFQFLFRRFRGNKRDLKKEFLKPVVSVHVYNQYV